MPHMDPVHARRRLLASACVGLPARALHALGGVGLLGLAATRPAHAQFRVEITGVGATQVPIAVARFRGEDTVNVPVAEVIRANLDRSGFFKAQDGSSNLDERSQPALAEWRQKPVDALLAGSVSRLADGRVDVRYKLWDVVRGNEALAQNAAVALADLRLAAHRISDAVYEKLTGDKGVFATRIAYVTRGGGRYTLRVADADGEGGQVALNSPEPIISPTWSADGKELAYVSFETQKAVVWAQNVASGQRRMVANFRGSNSAPAFSPDGQSLAVTLSRDGGSQIFLIDAAGGGTPRRVTQSSSIDTEPTFTPDGRTVYFVSDRGGGPQVYRTAVSGGSVERVSFTGGYNISPALSPDGKTLAYVSRQGGGYKLYVQDLGSSSQAVAITETLDDESPSFAPNGKLIIYATRAAGRDVLMTTTLDGRIKARLAAPAADVREPAWGPFGR
jgi:TolB protein